MNGALLTPGCLLALQNKMNLVHKMHLVGLYGRFSLTPKTKPQTLNTEAWKFWYWNKLKMKPNGKITFPIICFECSCPPLPPPPNVIYSRFWYAFSMLKLTKFPPPYGGRGSQGFLHKPWHEQVHSARSSCMAPERVRKQSKFGWNWIEYILLTTWDGNSIFSSANRARPVRKS